MGHLQSLCFCGSAWLERKRPLHNESYQDSTHTRDGTNGNLTIQGTFLISTEPSFSTTLHSSLFHQSVRATSELMQWSDKRRYLGKQDQLQHLDTIGCSCFWYFHHSRRGIVANKERNQVGKGRSTTNRGECEENTTVRRTRYEVRSQ